jgi:hypothetical protein
MKTWGTKWKTGTKFDFISGEENEIIYGICCKVVPVEVLTFTIHLNECAKTPFQFFGETYERTDGNKSD